MRQELLNLPEPEHLEEYVKTLLSQLNIRGEDVVTVVEELGEGDQDLLGEVLEVIDQHVDDGRDVVLLLGLFDAVDDGLKVEDNEL